MKKRCRFIFVLILAVVMIFAFSSTAFAISESDVQAQVDANGREAVAGNVFIWFLCAIAFLKVSQKIDSFMSSLGINVGHTGGSMLAEAVIAARGVSEGRNIIGGGFSGFGKRGSRGASGANGSGGSSGADGGFMSGGLAGVVGRHVSGSAVKTATGQGGGIVGGAMFNSSLDKGGDFANNVIGTVAKGSVAATGTMTGEQAAKGLASYLGYGAQGSSSAASGSVPDFSPGVSSPSFASVESDISGSAPDFSPSIDSSSFSSGDSADSPTGGFDTPVFSNVEIGGGRIMGMESTAENPDGIQFGMYHADQYVAPEGEHSVVQTVDGASWYKQYASDAVDKTPYMAPDGSIAYKESLVKKLPKMPQRKDRV